MPCRRLSCSACSWSRSIDSCCSSQMAILPSSCLPRAAGHHTGRRLRRLWSYVDVGLEHPSHAAPSRRAVRSATIFPVVLSRVKTAGASRGPAPAGMMAGGTRQAGGRHDGHLGRAARVDRPRPELQALQLKRLQGMLARLYERVPHYRAKLDDVGFTPGDPKSLDDLRAFEKEVSERLRLYL